MKKLVLLRKLFVPNSMQILTDVKEHLKNATCNFFWRVSLQILILKFVLGFFTNYRL